MDRIEFMKKFIETKEEMDAEKLTELLNEAITETTEENGNADVVKSICIEELAELSQALTKSIRGKTDGVNILEEIADVTICIYYMKLLFGITDEMIGKAMTVKAEKIEEKLEEYKKKRRGNIEGVNMESIEEEFKKVAPILGKASNGIEAVLGNKIYF